MALTLFCRKTQKRVPSLTVPAVLPLPVCLHLDQWPLLLVHFLSLQVSVTTPGGRRRGQKNQNIRVSKPTAFLLTSNTQSKKIPHRLPTVLMQLKAGSPSSLPQFVFPHRNLMKKQKYQHRFSFFRIWAFDSREVWVWIFLLRYWNGGLKSKGFESQLHIVMSNSVERGVNKLQTGLHI